MKKNFQITALNYKIILTIFACILISATPALAKQNKAASALVGLVIIDDVPPQNTLTKKKVNQLNADLFALLDKNNDESINLKEFGEWGFKNKSRDPAVSTIFKSVANKQIFSAADANGDSAITLSEMRLLSDFDFAARDSNQNDILDSDEMATQTPIARRLIQKDCPSVNSPGVGVFMGGLCALCQSQ